MKEEKLQLISQAYKKIIKNFYEELHFNKLDNLEELDKYLETCKFSIINQEETDNLNRTITSTKTELVMKNFQQTNVQD